MALADTTRNTTSLLELEELTQGCKGCTLFEGRMNVVFGDGSPDAGVLIIGEAPGKNEDLQGRPFVGAAGQLLNQMLERIGLEREDIYIANILKCRPPRNRDPLPAEIEACTPWLRAQIKAVHPTILVTMGNFSTKFVLQTKTGITQLRGKIHVTGPFRVIPTFHPAAAIYDRNKIGAIEQDFDLLRQLLDADERRESASE